MGICLMMVYFFNTGCLLYPIQQTCFGMVEWAIPETEVSRLNTHYQWWSKAGGSPGYKSPIEPEVYIQNFTWLNDWINRYFFNKVSDYLLGLSVLSIVFFLFFKTKKTNLDTRVFKNNIFFYYVLIFLLIEWFLYHPALRYGGYIIICLIFFVPLSFFLSSYVITKNFENRIVILFVLIISIFLGRNIDRIIYESNFYKANFNENMYFFTDKVHFRIDEQLKKFSKNYDDCNQNVSTCFKNKDFEIKKRYGKLIIIRIRN